MPTFKHSGDMGDCFYSLPAIRALGGGILYLDPDGGLSSPLIKWQGCNRTRLNRASIEKAIPFLKQQPYLTDVRAWCDEPVDHDLDEFRRHLRYNNLAMSHLAAMGLPLTECETAWLTVDSATIIPGKPFVIHRNVRYQGNDDFWEANLAPIAGQAVFIGSELEHRAFSAQFDIHVDYFPTPTLLDLARVIAGCTQFIGNEGLPRAIAEGFKKAVVVEMGRVCPNTQFARADAQYV